MHQLIVIAPVYNEEANLKQFVIDWIDQLRSLSIDFKLKLYDDGSADKSPLIAAELMKQYAELELFTKPNSGHGPTIYQAYTDSVTEAEWIFQLDSDHELEMNTFQLLWIERLKADILLGERRQTNQTLFRKILTGISSIAVRLLFGNKITDVNVPYRLMRSEKLKTILPLISKNCFAPNVLISAMAVKHNWVIVIAPVERTKSASPHLSKFSTKMLLGSIGTFRSLLLLKWKGKQNGSL
jgi:glycosyltransferase involved in cell wall biosynthesis